MGCGGGFNDLFRVYGNSCNNNQGYRGSNYQRDDTQEKISLIKRMYAEGKIDRDRYYALKDRAYNGRVSFEELIDIKEANIRESSITESRDSSRTGNSGDINPAGVDKDKDKDLKKYKDKISKLEASKNKVLEINGKIKERLEELISERERMEGIASTMVSSSEQVAREFIDKKLDLEENIQTLKNRQQDLTEEIEEIEKTIKNVETKILDYEAVKLQEELNELKGDI